MRVFRHGELPLAAAPVQDNWGRSTMMMRRSVAQRIGPILDPPRGAGCGEMIDWIARARELDVKLEMMPEVLALRRIRTGSMTSDHSSRNEGYLHVAKLALERKRMKPS
jgi:hypothetical protein